MTSIVGEEFHNELCPFPVIPYAVALSLRVSYQNLQLAKAEIFQKRARRQLASNCRLLRELGEVFYSASLMANLGEYLIEKGDGQQEPSDATRPQHRGDANHQMPSGNSKGPPGGKFSTSMFAAVSPCDLTILQKAFHCQIPTKPRRLRRPISLTRLVSLTQCHPWAYSITSILILE